MIMLTTVSILTSIVVAWFVLKPLLHAEQSGALQNFGLESNLEALLTHKSRCLQVLKDLELDFATQKVSPSDYETTKHNLSVELAAILSKIDALGG